MVFDFKKYLYKIIKPIISFSLRQGLTIQDFIEAAKVVFIEVAEEELIAKGEKPNTSRISAMTGIRRPEIKRVIYGEEYSPIPSLVSRVLAQWEQDRRFVTKAGKPKILSEEEFHKLVNSVSTDLHPGTVVFELQRLGLAEVNTKGISLKERHHVVTEDLNLGFSLLSGDISDLTLAVEENLLHGPEIKNLHGRTNYNNIYHEDLPEIKTWLLSEGTKFHHKVRNFLANYDKDVNPNPCKTAGASVTFCSFARVEKGKL